MLVEVERLLSETKPADLVCERFFLLLNARYFIRKHSFLLLLVPAALFAEQAVFRDRFKPICFLSKSFLVDDHVLTLKLGVDPGHSLLLLLVRETGPKLAKSLNQRLLLLWLDVFLNF